MNLLITNECSRRCPFCFLGDFKDGPRQEMPLQNIQRLLDTPDFSETYVCECGELHWRQILIMGGEPTLHSQFAEIIGLCLTRSRKTGRYKYIKTPATDLAVLTNGIMDADKAELIVGCNRLVNINEDYTDQERVQLFSSIQIWEQGEVFYSASLTITRPDQDFSFFTDIIRGAKKIKCVRLGISTPGRGFDNDSPFVRGEESPEYGEAYLRAIEEIKGVRPDGIIFRNECCLNDRLAEERTYRKILSHRVLMMKKVCFLPNMDILPDMSTYWCPAVSAELALSNVFEYGDLGLAKAELFRRFYDLCKELDFDPYRDTTGCIARKYHESLAAGTAGA